MLYDKMKISYTRTKHFLFLYIVKTFYICIFTLKKKKVFPTVYIKPLRNWFILNVYNRLDTLHSI